MFNLKSDYLVLNIIEPFPRNNGIRNVHANIEFSRKHPIWIKFIFPFQMTLYNGKIKIDTIG